MDNLYVYTGYTLIDITQTNVLTFNPQKERNQQRNWETIQQILSFRAQLMKLTYLGSTAADVKDYSFGANYTGEHTIWSFEFAVERPDIYSLDQDRYGTLKDDLGMIPVILGLDETAKPSKPLFFASGLEKNIYFIAHKPKINIV